MELSIFLFGIIGIVVLFFLIQFGCKIPETPTRPIEPGENGLYLLRVENGKQFTLPISPKNTMKVLRNIQCDCKKKKPHNDELCRKLCFIRDGVFI